MDASIAHIFVYGTLKTSQSNHYLIAPFIVETRPATVNGILYDCGLWPALQVGKGIVHGEVMTVAHHDLQMLLPVLDRLEEYNPADEDHSPYVRRLVPCRVADVEPVETYAYLYRGPLDGLKVLSSGRWPEGR
jgi:gamma-glutamylcyclotransferase (GGCT)/AIG2-like uncharacterized protein YtfP